MLRPSIEFHCRLLYVTHARAALLVYCPYFNYTVILKSNAYAMQTKLRFGRTYSGLLLIKEAG